jgi:hypothetical protein
MDAIYSPETGWLTFTGLHGAIYLQTELFMATIVKPSEPTLASSILQAAHFAETA